MYVQIREMPGSLRQDYRVEFRLQPTERPTVVRIQGSDKLRSLLEKKARMRVTEINRLVGALDGNASVPAYSEQCDLDADELRSLTRSLRDEEIVEQQAAEKAVK